MNGQKRRFWIAALMAMVGLAGLTGCGGNTQTSDNDIEIMRVEQVDAALEEGEAVLLDVRPEKAYHVGHIPGAINVPLPTIRRGDPRLANARQIIVYAGGWTDPLSTAGTKRLLALGYSNVYEFKGGTEVWRDAGGRLVETDPDATGRRETDR